MVVEEVRYDFEAHQKYADDFVRDLVKLMIISKMNSPFRNKTSKEYFEKLVSQMEGCTPTLVKYGQPLLYVKYRDISFTDQKVTSQFVRNVHIIDVTMESMFGEFVKIFDSLFSASQSKVQWGLGEKPDGMFALLDLFVEAICRLSALDPSSTNTLAGKKFGIRNAGIIRTSLHLEFLVDSRLNIIELNPAKRKKKAELLFGDSEAARAVVALINQA